MVFTVSSSCWRRRALLVPQVGGCSRRFGAQRSMCCAGTSGEYLFCSYQGSSHPANVRSGCPTSTGIPPKTRTTRAGIPLNRLRPPQQRADNVLPHRLRAFLDSKTSRAAPNALHGPRSKASPRLPFTSSSAVPSLLSSILILVRRTLPVPTRP